MSSLSTLGGAPRHRHIKTGRFYRPNIRPRGWRGEEESSSPNIHQTEVEGAAGLVSVMEKVLVDRETAKSCRAQKVLPALRSSGTNRSDFSTTKNGLKGVVMFGAAPGGGISSVFFQGNEARAGSGIPANPLTTPEAPGMDFGTR